MHLCGMKVRLKIKIMIHVGKPYILIHESMYLYIIKGNTFMQIIYSYLAEIYGMNPNLYSCMLIYKVGNK